MISITSFFLWIIILIVNVNQSYESGIIDINTPRQLKNVASVLLKSYTNAISTQPILVNMVTASTLSVISDAISQRIEINSNELVRRKQLALDPKSENILPSQKHSIYRSFCMSIYGAFISGFLVIQWIRFLNFIIPEPTFIQ